MFRFYSLLFVNSRISTRSLCTIVPHRKKLDKKSPPKQGVSQADYFKSSWYRNDKNKASGITEGTKIDKPSKELRQLNKLKQDQSVLLNLYQFSNTSRKDPKEYDRGALEPAATQSKNAVLRFDSLPLKLELTTKLANEGFTTATQIQRLSIPTILSRKYSVILHSETGSGKTLAFLLPIIQAAGSGKGRSVIVVPTRELASQIYLQAVSLARNESHVKLMTDLSHIDDSENQSASATLPCVIVGIPKVILEAVRLNEVWFTGVSRIVLDEVDKLLPPVNPGHFGSRRLLRIKDRHPKPTEVLLSMMVKLTEGRSQMIAASATVNRFMIDDLCSLGFGNKPVVIRTQEISNETQLYVPAAVNHQYVMVPKDDCNNTPASIAARIFRNSNHTSALVFVHRSASVQTFVDAMMEAGISCVALYKEAVTDNAKVMESFKEMFQKGSIQVVVGNEETVRGLDFPSLSAVYMTSVPRNCEEYLHMAGRVGRQGQPGSAVVIVNGSTEQDLKRLKSQYTRLNVEGKQLHLSDSQ